MHVHTVILCSCCSDNGPICLRFIPHLFCFTESQGNWPLWFTRFPGHLTQSLWGLWAMMCFVWALRASLVGMGFDSKCDFAPPTILLGLLLCPWMWGIFFSWNPTLLYRWLFSSELQVWGSCRRRWAHILLLHHLVSEPDLCLSPLQRYGSAVACHRAGTLGAADLWHKPSWKRSPVAPPYSHKTDDPQTAEQLYQINSHNLKKVLGPTTDFPNWESGKWTENPQGIWRPVEFDYRSCTGLGKQTLGGHKQNLVCTRTKEKGAVTLQETDLDLPVSIQESSMEGGQ